MQNSKDEHLNIPFEDFDEPCPIVVMENEDGTETDFFVISIYPAGRDMYVALTPTNGEDDEQPLSPEDEILICRVEEDDNGEEKYVPVEDEDELDMAMHVFVYLVNNS